MENAIAVHSQIEEMILKNNQIDGRTINFTQWSPWRNPRGRVHVKEYESEEKLSFSIVARDQGCILHQIKGSSRRSHYIAGVGRGEVCAGATITGGTVYSIRMPYLPSKHQKRSFGIASNLLGAISWWKDLLTRLYLKDAPRPWQDLNHPSIRMWYSSVESARDARRQQTQDQLQHT